ncbi:ATP-dependent helicase [Micromonospora aurantiaca]|uniref:DNA 3'-5' helicase n=1 Tax=Micromonospora aurantiaca (nom. illeg.) TaxID=47850 RepID=A0A6N3K7B9_9ACTN|nr:ATP-dependent helicase [Micromonospora aurantiaca]AXH93562.1 ATP-dependent helicase [Micromonospora aurantiaca]
MITPLGLTPGLTRELDALNDGQRAAALHAGNLVVLAGPGSGKTRTLVAKAAYLLETQIPPRRGLAAITYTRHAAQEISRRLDRLGVRTGRRLTANTLHSWCLNAILRPYGPLVGIPAPGPGSVIDDRSDEWVALLQECLDGAGVGATARYERHAIVRIRRRLAAGVPEDTRDPVVAAAILFDQRLTQRGQFDFDLMIARSLQLLRGSDRATRLVAARYPWLLVDEYQDLGPVLHTLVGHLHDTAGVSVAAFGDPDQTIMGFTGADPAYLLELADREDFDHSPLVINYRCGKAIIAASHATVDGHRAHQPDPRRTDPGVIEPIAVAGGLADHARLVLSKIDELAAEDVPFHHIAIFYPRKGQLLNELVKALDSSIFEYIHEGDQRLPDGDLADFVRDCAARAVGGPQPVGYTDVDHASAIPTIHDLANDYRSLIDASGIGRPGGHVVERMLSRSLQAVEPDHDLRTWLGQLIEHMDLDAVARTSPQLRDRAAIGALHDAASRHELTVGDIAGALRTGKVTLTTYHAAKGREWDFILMPGLVDGIMPFRKWSQRHGRHMETPSDQFEQDRRAFYVGLTRAKQAAVLIYGEHWETGWGAENRYGVSPFVKAVLAKMGST